VLKILLTLPLRRCTRAADRHERISYAESSAATCSQQQKVRRWKIAVQSAVQSI